jgi:hypothetical protein
MCARTNAASFGFLSAHLAFLCRLRPSDNETFDLQWRPAPYSVYTGAVASDLVGIEQLGGESSTSPNMLKLKSGSLTSKSRR